MPELNLATQPVACALCGREAYTPLCWNDSLQIVRCLDCGLVFVNPQPTEGALQQYYSAQDFQEQYGWSDYFQLSPGRLRELWQRRFDEVRKRKNGSSVRLLDVGCGYGDFLYQVKQGGWQVYGFEFSPTVAQISRRKYGIPVEVGEIFDLQVPGNSFDVVTMWHVLEHVRDPFAVLMRCHELLALDGLLVLEVPNLNFLVRKSYRYPLSVTLHLYHFSAATLSALVQKAGFQVLECRQGHTGFLYRSKAKICAKKCFYAFSLALEKLLSVNVSDSIRLYARRNNSWWAREKGRSAEGRAASEGPSCASKVMKQE